IRHACCSGTRAIDSLESATIKAAWLDECGQAVCRKRQIRSPRRDIERKRLGRRADPLRAGGQCLLLPPAQGSLIQLANFSVNRGRHGDDYLAEAVRDARDYSGALVDLEPGGTLLEVEAG